MNIPTGNLVNPEDAKKLKVELLGAIPERFCEVSIDGNRIIGKAGRISQFGFDTLQITEPNGKIKCYPWHEVKSIEPLTQDEARKRYLEYTQYDSGTRSGNAIQRLHDLGFLAPLKESVRPWNVPSVYVASSWRNQSQESVVEALRKLGCYVYDFKHPQNHPEKRGFSWKDVNEQYIPGQLTIDQYISMISSDVAMRAYQSDYQAIRNADVTVLVQPCGRSAHWELGCANGMNKPTYVLLADNQEPELMISASKMCSSLGVLCEAIRSNHINEDIPF